MHGAPVIKRKARPEALRFILSILRRGNKNIGLQLASNTVAQIAHALVTQAKYKKDDALSIVQDALQDGLLVPTTDNTLAKRFNDNKLIVRLLQPNEYEKAAIKHDVYCYECHLPGELLHCIKCTRAYHQDCTRQDPEIPNSTSANDVEINIASRPASGNPVSVHSDELFNITSIPQHNIPMVENPNQQPQLPETICTVKMEEADIKYDMDIICLGETRAPKRQRHRIEELTSAATIKNEQMEMVNEQLCTVCRLKSIIFNPPNIGHEELCHLLKFTPISKYSIATASTHLNYKLKMSTSENEFICSLLFFNTNISTLDEIKQKLLDSKYNTLMEFITDILDIEHNIGIFFGDGSNELKKMQELVRDITFNVGEIRRCPDCFRYSYEKLTPLWFALPCLQRHELVYAKTKGFSYWPAKIMHRLPNDMYEVRFFGGKHYRADVPANQTKTIDFDELKVETRSPGLKNAIEELGYHKLLLDYGAHAFAFGANKTEIEKILQTVLNPGKCEKNASRKRGRGTVGILNAQQHMEANESMQNGASWERLSKRCRSSSAKMLAEKRRKQEVPSLKVLNRLQAQEIEIRQLQTEERSKIRCYTCQKLEPTKFCCFRASYCSATCQREDWSKGHHKKVCLNKNNNILTLTVN